MKTNISTSQFSIARLAIILGLVIGFTSGLALDSSAQTPKKRRPSRKRVQDKSDSKDDKKSDEKKKSDDKKSDDKKEEKKSDVTAIVGGNIHTVSGPVIREGTILIEEGKILKVGQDIEVPEGAKVIDAKGKTITPGFVAISMQGIAIRSTPSGKDKLEDAFDPFDRNLKYALGVGITTGCVQLGGARGGFRRRAGEPEQMFPGIEKPNEEFVTESMLDYGDENTSLCPCCGLPILPTEALDEITPAPAAAPKSGKSAVIKLSYGNVDAMLMKENAFYSLSTANLTGALNRHNWRLNIKRTRELIEAQSKNDKEKLATASKPKTSSSKSSTAKKTATKRLPKVNEELKALLNGETKMRVRADSVGQIRSMVQLAEELGYEIIIEGGTEAWVIAKELGASEVGVIYTPRRRRNARKGFEDSSGSFVESPKLFQETGVPFSVAALSNSISMGGLAGRDLSSLPLEAAFAVRGGADERKALEAITLTPAKMMGLDDRIGSIEEGKDADILILNGGPLDYRTYVEHAIVAGKVSYDRAKDKVLPVYDRKDN